MFQHWNRKSYCLYKKFPTGWVSSWSQFGGKCSVGFGPTELCLCSRYNSHHSLPTRRDSPSITLTDNTSPSNNAYTALWRMWLSRVPLKCVSIYKVVLDCVHLGGSVSVCIKHNRWRKVTGRRWIGIGSTRLHYRLNHNCNPIRMTNEVILSWHNTCENVGWSVG